MTTAICNIFTYPFTVITGTGAASQATLNRTTGEDQPTVQVNFAYRLLYGVQSFIQAIFLQGQVPDVVNLNIWHLRSHLLMAVAISTVVAMYYAYKIMKKGSALGAQMVVHPELCPEPLPAGR